MVRQDGAPRGSQIGAKDTHPRQAAEAPLHDFGLSPRAIHRVLVTALDAGGEFSELFLEYRLSTTVVMEEDIIKETFERVSLGAGVIFPSLAILHTALVADQTLPPKMSPGALRCLVMELAPTGSPLRPYLGAIGLTARAAFLTALGGLILAGALSSSDYMMQVSQFRGVKLAQLLPMVLVLVATLARSLPAWRESVPGWAAWRAALVAAGGAVVRYWHAIAIMVALGTVAFMVMRSGNQSAVEVSEFELRLRAILDQVLLVRPRTKEILVGYPALMLGLWLLLRGRPRASWVLLSLGAISQVSLLNTFCHLHTPLTVSLLRAVNGLWVGLAVGGVWWLLRFAGERVLRVIWWSSPP